MHSARPSVTRRAHWANNGRAFAPLSFLDVPRFEAGDVENEVF